MTYIKIEVITGSWSLCATQLSNATLVRIVLRMTYLIQTTYIVTVERETIYECIQSEISEWL